MAWPSFCSEVCFIFCSCFKLCFSYNYQVHFLSCNVPSCLIPIKFSFFFSWAMITGESQHIPMFIFLAGWWFGTFFIFPYIGNNHPNWRSYFSEGWPNHQPVLHVSPGHPFSSFQSSRCLPFARQLQATAGFWTFPLSLGRRLGIHDAGSASCRGVLDDPFVGALVV